MRGYPIKKIESWYFLNHPSQHSADPWPYFNEFVTFVRTNDHPLMSISNFSCHGGIFF